jgi:hypothetical protein
MPIIPVTPEVEAEGLLNSRPAQNKVSKTLSQKQRI